MGDRPDQPVILVLGAGHWANPNHDVVNVPYDDMLRPERQAEIRDCVDRLARFAPTKIALEQAVGDNNALNDDYQRFRDGSFALTADERHQLGFQIASAVGHEQLFGIDWNEPIGDLGLVLDYARRHQPDLYAEFSAPSTQTEHATQSVRESLREINSAEALRRRHQPYLTLSRVGIGSHYVGIDWVKGWYQRNLIIFANLARIATTPSDRVLVIYGAGHVPLLTLFIQGSGCFELGAVETYLE